MRSLNHTRPTPNTTIPTTISIQGRQPNFQPQQRQPSQRQPSRRLHRSQQSNKQTRRHPQPHTKQRHTTHPRRTNQSLTNRHQQPLSPRRKRLSHPRQPRLQQLQTRTSKHKQLLLFPRSRTQHLSITRPYRRLTTHTCPYLNLQIRLRPTTSGPSMFQKQSPSPSLPSHRRRPQSNHRQPTSHTPKRRHKRHTKLPNLRIQRHTTKPPLSPIQRPPKKRLAVPRPLRCLGRSPSRATKPCIRVKLTPKTTNFSVCHRRLN